MVRINLLPDRKQAKARGAGAVETGQLWLLVILGLIVLEIVALVFVHNAKQNELKAVTSENQRIQGQIDAINRQISDQGAIKAQLADLEAREAAITKLQSGRTGPTTVMMEISRILTPGKGPTTDKDKLEQLKRDNPTAAMNPNWDGRRLWLVNYAETERAVRMNGLAKDAEDVSEFERRLILSDYFFEVALLPGGRVIDPTTKQELVRFELSAKVRY